MLKQLKMKLNNNFNKTKVKPALISNKTVGINLQIATRTIMINLTKSILNINTKTKYLKIQILSSKTTKMMCFLTI